MVQKLIAMVKGEKGVIRLQKRFAYTYNDRDHFKYVVTVPEDIISALGWREKQELEPKVDNGKLVFTERKEHHKHR